MSLKSVKKSLKDGEEIFSVTRKEKSLILSKNKYLKLHQIVCKTVAATNFFLKEFAGTGSLFLVTKPRLQRDRYVKEGLPKELKALKLQDRQWKMCLEKAFENLSSAKAITEKSLKESLVRSKLSERQRHLVCYILKRAELLQFILNHEIEQALDLLYCYAKAKKFNSLLKEELTQTNPKKVFLWLRRRYRELYVKNQRPKIRKKRTYHLDPDMYQFLEKDGRCYIGVASLEPRKRIFIPLINQNLKSEDFSGNIKVVLRHDEKVEVHRSIHSVCKVSPKITPKKETTSIKGVDKGFTDLLHCSSGEKYGIGYGAKLNQWSDDLQKVNSGRARMHALKRNLEKRRSALPKTASPKQRRLLNQKISAIKKNNLQSNKVKRKREYIKNEIQKEIGTAINQFYKAEKPMVLVVENLDFDGGYHFSKRTNRLLKTWHKGLLQDGLKKGSKMNCVQLEIINAAYTSQLCRNCGAVDAKNRNGDQFACVYCEHKVDANFNASLNIRDRIFDPEIRPYMPYTQVKEILLKRHRLSLPNLGLKENGYSSSANDLNL